MKVYEVVDDSGHYCLGELYTTKAPADAKAAGFNEGDGDRKWYVVKAVEVQGADPLRERLVALLSGLASVGDGLVCVQCGRSGHFPDCSLAELLKELKG